MYKPAEDNITGGTKKFSLYPFGMSEKLFVPKSHYEKVKNVFKRF